MQNTQLQWLTLQLYSLAKTVGLGYYYIKSYDMAKEFLTKAVGIHKSRKLSEIDITPLLIILADTNFKLANHHGATPFFTDSISLYSSTSQIPICKRSCAFESLFLTCHPSWHCQQEPVQFQLYPYLSFKHLVVAAIVNCIHSTDFHHANHIIQSSKVLLEETSVLQHLLIRVTAVAHDFVCSRYLVAAERCYVALNSLFCQLAEQSTGIAIHPLFFDEHKTNDHPNLCCKAGYQQSLSVMLMKYRDIYGRDHIMKMYSLTSSLGNLYLRLGLYRESAAYFIEAMMMHRYSVSNHTRASMEFVDFVINQFLSDVCSGDCVKATNRLLQYYVYNNEIGPLSESFNGRVNLVHSMVRKMAMYKQFKVAELILSVLGFTSKLSELEYTYSCPKYVVAGESTSLGLAIVMSAVRLRIESRIAHDEDQRTKAERYRCVSSLVLMKSSVHYGAWCHPVIPRMLNDMGVMYNRQSCYQSASMCYKEALTIYKCRSEDPCMLIVMRNLALNSVQLGNTSEAIQFCSQVKLGINSLKEPLKEKLCLGSALMNIGTVYMKRSQFREGVTYYTNAVDAYNEVYGDGRKQPNELNRRRIVKCCMAVVESVINGEISTRSHDRKGILIVIPGMANHFSFEKVVKLLLQTFVPWHGDDSNTPKGPSCFTNPDNILQWLHNDCGLVQERATDCFTLIARAYKEIFGDHGNLMIELLAVADKISYMGWNEHLRGNLVKAEKHFKFSLAIYKELFTTQTSNINIALTVNRLGFNTSARGHLFDAEMLYIDALRDYESASSSADDWLLGVILVNRASNLIKMVTRSQDALECCLSAWEIFEERTSQKLKNPLNLCAFLTGQVELYDIITSIDRKSSACFVFVSAYEKIYSNCDSKFRERMVNIGRDMTCRGKRYADTGKYSEAGVCIWLALLVYHGIAFAADQNNDVFSLLSDSSLEIIECAYAVLTSHPKFVFFYDMQFVCRVLLSRHYWYSGCSAKSQLVYARCCLIDLDIPDNGLDLKQNDKEDCRESQCSSNGSSTENYVENMTGTEAESAGCVFDKFVLDDDALEKFEETFLYVLRELELAWLEIPPKCRIELI